MSLPLTGERTVPGVAEENYWFRRHQVAYLHAAELVTGRTVVDVGCGEGYGTDMLGEMAARIVGVDYDAAAIAHAARSYPRPHFVRGNLAAVPVRTAAVDVVVTLQVVEHVWNHREFVGECLRLLRPGGLLYVTTPNRLTFSPGLDEPANLFHTREFTATELAELLRAGGFEIDQVLGVHAGPRLAALDGRHGGSFVEAQLAVPPERWSARLRRDVTGIGTGDFRILAAHVHDVDESLDLVVLARRPR